MISPLYANSEARLKPHKLEDARNYSMDSCFGDYGAIGDVTIRPVTLNPPPDGAEPKNVHGAGKSQKQEE